MENLCKNRKRSPMYSCGKIGEVRKRASHSISKEQMFSFIDYQTQSSMKKTFIILILSLSMATSCEDCEGFCDAVTAADLLIPQVADVLDQFGNPVIYNGVTMRDFNEVYHNLRTGEIFSHAFPPTYPVLLGDFLEIGTRVFNNWYDTSCEKGRDAGPSLNLPNLSYQGPAGFGSVPLNPSFTPGIALNDYLGGWTVSGFQLNAPGYYKVDFNANFDQTVAEHGFGNNLYYGGNGGNQFGMTVAASFAVEESTPGNAPWVCKELPSTVVAQCDYYKQFDWGTTESNYEKSPLIRFLQVPGNLARYYQFKIEHPDKPFVISE